MTEDAVRPVTDLPDLLPDLYEAALHAEMWPDVLSRAASFIGTEALLIGQFPTDAPWTGLYWLSNWDPDTLLRFMQVGEVDRSIYTRAMAALPEGVTFDYRSYGASDRQGDDPAIRLMLGPQQFLEGRFGTLVRDGALVAPVACCMRGRRGTLDAARVARLDALLPHLRRAMQVQIRTQRLSGEVEMLTTALRRLAVGVMFVTEALELRFANAEAERILALADGLGLRGRRLAFADPRARTALAGEVQRVARREAGTTVPPVLHLPRPSGAPPYSVCVAPASGAVEGMAPPASAAATLYVTDPAAPRSASSRALRDGFGLTATEAEVAQLVATGQGLQRVAGTLGVSVNTVRTHLKAVYAKTGVNHQAALARLVAAGAPPVLAEEPARLSPDRPSR